jgi:type I restriction enzyme, R subunit
MTNTPSFREELVSQIPALRLLMALGGEYLPPDEALTPRDVQGMYPYIKAR